VVRPGIALSAGSGSGGAGGVPTASERVAAGGLKLSNRRPG